MLKRFVLKTKLSIKTLKQVFYQFKQYAFELKTITTCNKTKKHLIEVKIVGKSQSIFCLAEEIVADDEFIKGFSPLDVRTISYLAATDKYEEFLHQEKIKKSYEMIRSKNVNGKKAVIIRNKLTGDSNIKIIQDFSSQEIIDNLESSDAYQLGYFVGQEQTRRDFSKLKLLSSKKAD